MQYTIDEFGAVRVNGIEYVRFMDAIITLRKSVLPKKVEAMKKTSAMGKLRTTILPKKVQEWKKKKTEPPSSKKSHPSKFHRNQNTVTINTPPAVPEPEEKTEETLAVPVPDALTIEELPAAPKPEPQAIIHKTTAKNMITII